MKYRRGREQKKDRLCRDFGLDGMADEDREEKNLFVAFMILENENDRVNGEEMYVVI